MRFGWEGTVPKIKTHSQKQKIALNMRKVKNWFFLPCIFVHKSHKIQAKISFSAYSKQFFFWVLVHGQLKMFARY
jgi:hypothetical protein